MSNRNRWVAALCIAIAPPPPRWSCSLGEITSRGRSRPSNRASRPRRCSIRTSRSTKASRDAIRLAAWRLARSRSSTCAVRVPPATTRTSFVPRAPRAGRCTIAGRTTRRRDRRSPLRSSRSIVSATHSASRRISASATHRTPPSAPRWARSRWSSAITTMRARASRAWPAMRATCRWRRGLRAGRSFRGIRIRRIA